MRSGQVFCNLEKYLCANFQVKWSKNEGGVAISRLFFSKKDQKYSVLTRILKKITFKSLLLLHSLTILLENLLKGTSQGCKKLDRSAFLNFCFFCYLQRVKIPKIAKMAIFAGFCAINSAKMKNSKIRSGQVFWTIERYLCANFQVKWSSGQ